MIRRSLATVIFLTVLLGLSGSAWAQDSKRGGRTVVILETTKGVIEIELNEEKAPISAENFLTYVDASFYDGTIFHRVIPDFMVQGGGMTADMKQKETRAAIHNEADNGLTNERGTVAMARTSDIHSATGQFFFNLKNNDFLNHGGRDFGYAVFGRVVNGMDVVDAIAKVPTGFQDVPNETITITTARRKAPPASE